MNTEQRSEIIRRAAAKMWVDDGQPMVYLGFKLDDEVQSLLHFGGQLDAKKFSYLRYPENSVDHA